MKHSAQRNAIVSVCDRLSPLGADTPRDPRFFLEDGTPLNFLGLSKPNSSCEPAPYNLVAVAFEVGSQKGKISREELDCLFRVTSVHGTTVDRGYVGVVLFSNLPESETKLACTQIEHLQYNQRIAIKEMPKLPKTATPFFFARTGRVATYVPLITD